jgi:hypothetical protein
MQTFSATIALEDDDGNRYDPESYTGRLRDMLAGEGVEVFSVAIGNGIDTETDDTEPIVIVQGVDFDGCPNALAVCEEFAGILRQRAIGWFVSDDSYRNIA